MHHRRARDHQPLALQRVWGSTYARRVWRLTSDFVTGGFGSQETGHELPISSYGLQVRKDAIESKGHLVRSEGPRAFSAISLRHAANECARTCRRIDNT